MPKKYLSSYLIFSASRQESGDFKNIAVPERAKLIGQEWKALTQEEKEVRLLGVAGNDFPRTDADKCNL
jgi:hypothetical protein